MVQLNGRCDLALTQSLGFRIEGIKLVAIIFSTSFRYPLSNWIQSSSFDIVDKTSRTIGELLPYQRRALDKLHVISDALFKATQKLERTMECLEEYQNSPREPREFKLVYSVLLLRRTIFQGLANVFSLKELS